MNKYGLYNKVIEASKTEDEGMFNAAARNWIEGADTVNFENNEANDLFNSAKYHCAAWRNKAINGRVGKLRMIECVRKIVEMNLPNPYDPNEKEPVIEEPVVEEPIVKEEKEEKTHVFGVVPNVHLGFEKYDGVEEPKQEEEQKPEETQKHIFGRKNRK